MSQQPNRHLARALLAIIALLTSYAFAQTAPTLELSVPAQPMETTLRHLAEKHKVQFVYSPAVVRGVPAPELKGTYTLDQAMQRLTAGTRLAYSYNGKDTVVIREPGPGDRGGQPENPTVLAQAGSAERREGSADRSAIRLEGITVTAQKRTELLMDVPQSVTVLSSSDLARLGATQFRDFANTVPGLTFTTLGAGYNQISLRGVTAGNDLSPTVGIYIDEVPYGSSTIFAVGPKLALDVGLFDLDRVEVLRGPQGTLYGASTMGGLIKYVTKAPDTNRAGGTVQAGVASITDGGLSYNVAGAANAPIAPSRAALRLSAYYSDDGGYIDNSGLDHEDVNRGRVRGARGDLLLTPTRDLSIRLTGSMQDISRGGEGTINHSLTGSNGALVQRRILEEPFEQTFKLASATINYEMDWASLASITSYQSAQSGLHFDSSALYVPLFAGAPYNRTYGAVGLEYAITTDRVVQELRLASPTGTRFEWIVGGYYTRERSQTDVAFVPFNTAGQRVPNDLFVNNRPSEYREYAAFGDLTFRLSEKFDITGGMRYARNELETELAASGLFGAPQAHTESRDHITTYLANARYHFSESTTAYVRYATGYRPGGPNFNLRDATTGLPVGPTTFEADDLESYEIGFRADTMDRRYGIDVGIYYIDWSNIQLAVTRGGFSGTINAPGGATIKGGELALVARPITGLQLTGAFGWQDAKLAAADADLRAANGERLPNVPKFTAALIADYQISAEGLRPTIGGTFRHVGDRKIGFGAAAYGLPDYSTIDLRGGITWMGVTGQLFVHNLTNKRGQISSSSTGAILRTAIIEPRTIGVLLTSSF